MLDSIIILLNASTEILSHRFTYVITVEQQEKSLPFEFRFFNGVYDPVKMRSKDERNRLNQFFSSLNQRERIRFKREFAVRQKLYESGYDDSVVKWAKDYLNKPYDLEKTSSMYRILHFLNWR